MTRMNPEQVAAVMSSKVAQEMLKRNLVRLAYVAKDGTPRVIPIGFSWNGETLAMCTATNAAKIPALRANPNVALTIDTDAFPPNILFMRGTATVELVEGIPDEYMQANDSSYMTDEQRTEWEAGVRGLYDAMYVIRVTPTWAKAIDFETSLPSAVEELIQQKQAPATS